MSGVTRPGDCCAGAGLSFMVPNESCTNCFRKPVHAQPVLALYVQYAYETACRICSNSFMKLVLGLWAPGSRGTEFNLTEGIWPELKSH